MGSEGASAVLALADSWTFYYDESPPKGTVVANYDDLIKVVGSFDTIQVGEALLAVRERLMKGQGFWRYYNNFVDPSSFPKGSNLRMFKGNIKPAWEDPNNVEGGRWVRAPSSPYFLLTPRARSRPAIRAVQGNYGFL
jgi:hypothetical protein